MSVKRCRSQTRSDLPKRAAVRRSRSFKIHRRQARTPQAVRAGHGRGWRLRSFVMLDPRNMMARNPVMFLVEIGTVLTAIVTVQSIVNHAATGLIVYQASLTLAAVATVLFANFAEALAEARGKAQADSLRATPRGYPGLSARRPRRRTTGQIVSSTKLRTGDYVAGARPGR